jgi:plasmid maintenance system antidote protein VapI
MAKLDVSQAGLAVALGLKASGTRGGKNSAHVSRLANGERPATAEMFVKLAGLLTPQAPAATSPAADAKSGCPSAA